MVKIYYPGKRKVLNWELLIECTLKRNARFDIVDFYINREKWICVRAIHPIQHLNQEELAFLMLTVASEADRLEQIMLGFDYH